MNSVSKTYIPDSNIWIKYFRRRHHERVEQKGGANMVTIATEPIDSQRGGVKLNLVSPVEAAADRVESVIRRIKKRRTGRTVSRGKARKAATTTKKRKRAGSNRQKRKTSIKNKKKAAAGGKRRKRKTIIKKDIFT